MKGRVLAPFEAWVPMSFSVSNRGDADTEILLTSYFVEQPDLNFSRRVWVPAHAVRQVEYRVFTPPSRVASGTSDAKDLHTLLIVKEHGIETAVRFRGGERFDSRAIRCADFASRMILIRDPEVEDPHLLINSFLGDKSIFLSLFQAESLPTHVADYASVDNVVLTSNRIIENRAALNALRQWVLSGGNLWIMLDRVDSAVLDEFISDGSIIPIETVDLTTVQVTTQPGNRFGGDQRPVVYESPVQMVNVVSTGFQELAHVNGWPVALKAESGRGSLLVTTLGSEAWRFTPELQQERSGERNDYTENGLTSSGAALKGYFLDYLTIDDHEAVDLSALTAGQIGYEIPSRNLVIGILGGFCLILPVLGYVLSRRSDLLKITWIAPALAVVCMGTLVALGNSSRLAIDPMEVTTQIVELEPSGNGYIEAARATYRQNSGTAEIVFPSDGLEDFSPPLPGTTKRMVMADDDTVHWENLELPAGEQSSIYQVEQRFQPTAGVITADESGFHGQLVGENLKGLSDGLIAFPSGRLSSVDFSGEGQLKSALDDTLPRDEYLAGQVLGDRQQRRMEVYRQYLTGRRLIPDEPRLYAWSDSFDPQIVDVEGARKTGDALLSIPLMIQRPPAGTHYRLSPAMISYRADVHREWGSSTVYRNSTKTWSSSTSENSYSMLRCSIPEALGRVDVQSVEMLMDLKVANRVLEIVIVKPDDSESVFQTLDSPVGEFRLTFDDPSYFANDPADFFTVILHVGAPKEEIEGEGENVLGWSIKDVEFRGEFVAK